MKPTIAIYDAATDVLEVREMTDAEYSEYLKLQEKLAEEKLERETKENEAQAKRLAALAKLEALGLNETDLQALGL